MQFQTLPQHSIQKGISKWSELAFWTHFLLVRLINKPCPLPPSSFTPPLPLVPPTDPLPPTIFSKSFLCYHVYSVRLQLSFLSLLDVHVNLISHGKQCWTWTGAKGDMAMTRSHKNNPGKISLPQYTGQPAAGEENGERDQKKGELLGFCHNDADMSRWQPELGWEWRWEVQNQKLTRQSETAWWDNREPVSPVWRATVICQCHFSTKHLANYFRGRFRGMRLCLSWSVFCKSSIALVHVHEQTKRKPDGHRVDDWGSCTSVKIRG